MYSWEITNIMQSHNYIIDSNIYIEILETSPQLNHIKYDPYGDCIEMWDTESNYWKFKVYPEERK